MKNVTFRDYARVCREIESLEDKKTKLKDEILRQMSELQTKRVKNRYGLFTVGVRPSWLFSSKVNEMRLTISKLQDLEKENGTATVTGLTTFLRHQ